MPRVIIIAVDFYTSNFLGALTGEQISRVSRMLQRVPIIKIWFPRSYSDTNTDRQKYEDQHHNTATRPILDKYLSVHGVIPQRES